LRPGGIAAWPFPTNCLDARRLRQELAKLARRDSDAGAAIASRARATLERMRADFPGDVRARRAITKTLVPFVLSGEENNRRSRAAKLRRLTGVV